MPDARTVVSKLHQVDPGFRDLCNTLFGGAVDVETVYETVYTREGIAKSFPDQADLHAPGTGGFRPTGRRRSKPKPAVHKSERRVIEEEILDAGEVLDEISKAEVDLTIFTEFSKRNDDKHEVFGWASVVELNGQPVEDRQGDIITPDELERAAYSYVQKSRVGGHQHRRDGDSPFHASDMIESLVLTKEKVEKMGLPPTTPLGWWVGYKVHDEDTWSAIKKGDLTGFSIHGRGRRVPIEA